MIVAFKSRYNDPDLASNLIAYWTESDWTHCEILLEQPRQVAVSVRPDHDGVIVESWPKALTNPQQWEYFEVGVNSDTDVLAFLLNQTGKEFNYTGLVFGQVLKRPIVRNKSWFCSELAYSVIHNFGEIGLPYRHPAQVSPALLRQYLIDAQCPQISINNLISY